MVFKGEFQKNISQEIPSAKSKQSYHIFHIILLPFFLCSSRKKLKNYFPIGITSSVYFRLMLHSPFA